MSEIQGEQQRIRVVVVDDHQVVREGLRMMLEILGEGFSLVGEAPDGVSAIRVVEEIQPDVVLMDLRMPGMDGLEAIKRILSEWPQVAIVILTTYNEDEWLLKGLRAGACGYLLKDASSETLFHAIRSAARGETLLQPDVLARLLSHTSHLAETPQVRRRVCQEHRAYRTRTRSPGCSGARRTQQGDRHATRYQPAHRRGPPDQHLHQARR